MSLAPVATAEPLRRLHPLSPLLHSAKTLGVAIAAISWQGFAQLGLARWLAVLVVLLLGAVALSVVSWLVTGYHVVGRELRIREGLLWRRNRAIPLDRLQAVDLVRPALARLVGLAELRLEVIGASKAEAPLAYLSVADAAALRTRLLSLSTVASPPAAVPSAAHPAAAATEPVAPAPPAVEQERPVHRVVNQDVVIGQLLTPQAWLVPIGMLFVITQFAFEGSRTFIGIASTTTALIGIAVQPVRRVLDDWDFRLSTAQAGLRLRHGLLDTRSQTVPLSRVQAVGVTWPLLWRPKRWLRCRIDVAGYGALRGRGEGGPTNRLLPVGDLATARLVVAEALPGVDVAALALVRPPARARWLAPVRQPILGAALTDRVFASVDGPLTRELVVVPYARIQSVRVVQGPLQRRLRLATVHADTAGALHAVAHHWDVDEAWALAAELAARARGARSLG